MIPNARPMKGLRGKLRINERMSKPIIWRASVGRSACHRTQRLGGAP